MIVEPKPNFPLRLDIQFFAGEGEGEVYRGGYNPDEEITIPEPSQNPLLGEGDPIYTEEQPEQTEEIEGQQTEQFETVPPVVSPEVAQMQEQYNQLLLQNQQMFQMFQQMQMQQPQFQQQFQQQEQAPVESAPVWETDPDAFMERLYENPQATLREYTSKIVEQAISQVRAEYEPIVKERQFSDEINRMQSKYSDFNDMIPHITQVVDELGEDFVNQRGLDYAYQIAKGRAVAQSPQPPQPQDLLNDPNYLQQLVNNPQVQQMVMQQQLQQRQANRPPTLMSNQGSAQTLAPTQRPKSISEASKLVRKNWGL